MLDPQAHQDLQDLEDFLACLEKMEILAEMEKQVPWGLLGHQENVDCLACQVCQGQRGTEAFQALMGPKVDQDLLVRKERKAHLDRLGRLVPWDQQVQEVKGEGRVLLGRLD